MSSFSLLILGCGSALPTISSNQSAQVLSIENHSFLIDCGEGTQVELRRNKVKMQQIGQVFISHLHGDHFFGLVGLLSTLHLLGRSKDLQVFGPVGLEEIVKIQLSKSGNQLSYKIEFIEVKTANQVLFENKRIKISSLPLKHRVPCFGFLFQEKPGLRKLKVEALKKYKIPTYARKGITEGSAFTTAEGEIIPNELISDPPHPTRSYAYCSDTAYHNTLIDSLPSVDLLYHEATFLDRDGALAKKTGHSTSKDAARVANLIGAKKLLMGHFSNRYKSTIAFEQEARQIFKESYVAEEGKVYEL